MSPQQRCVLCSSEAIEFSRLLDPEGRSTEEYYFKCKICGQYESSAFDDEAYKRLSPEDKAMISAYTRERFVYNLPTPKL